MIQGDDDENRGGFHEGDRADIEIRFPVGEAAHRKEGDDRAVVGQRIEAA